MISLLMSLYLVICNYISRNKKDKACYLLLQIHEKPISRPIYISNKICFVSNKINKQYFSAKTLRRILALTSKYIYALTNYN